MDILILLNRNIICFFYSEVLAPCQRGRVRFYDTYNTYEIGYLSVFLQNVEAVEISTFTGVFLMPACIQLSHPPVYSYPTPCIQLSHPMYTVIPPPQALRAEKYCGWLAVPLPSIAHLHTRYFFLRVLFYRVSIRQPKPVAGVLRVYLYPHLIILTFTNIVYR